jgi:hypothetical protein
MPDTVMVMVGGPDGAGAGAGGVGAVAVGGVGELGVEGDPPSEQAAIVSDTSKKTARNTASPLRRRGATGFECSYSNPVEAR